MIDAVIREIVADIDFYESTLGDDPVACLEMRHMLRWRTGLRAVLELSDADDLTRLRAVDAAAREYAESRVAWEAALREEDYSDDGLARWRTTEARQETARTALLTLVAPAAPVVLSATTDAGTEDA